MRFLLPAPDVLRAASAFVLGTVALILLPGTALGHFGPGVTPEHMAIEVAEWALGVAAVIGAVVFIFWVRSRRSDD